MVSSCSILFTDFRTVFVFVLRPFLPLSVKFSSGRIFGEISFFLICRRRLCSSGRNDGLLSDMSVVIANHKS